MDRMKPTKQYRNFRDFLNKNKPYKWDENYPLNYWCAECEGHGKVVDPEYEPYYESHTEYIKCPKCSGTKVGSLTDLKALYSEWSKRHKDRLKAYKETEKRFKRLTQGMSPEEIKLIREWDEK